MTKEEQIEYKHVQDLERLKAFRLMDDEFMTACFDGNPESVELVLQIIMDRTDLRVLDVKVQYFLKNLLKRSVWLDVLATDQDGKKYNIEIQRSDKGASAKRARYHSSLIDAKVMEKRADFDELPESYVIFVTENDVLGNGEPIYHIDRYVQENGEYFGDEAHIIYVNGTYRGDDPLGRLMEDFCCTEPSKMYYNVLKDRVSYFKENKEGVAIMCRAIEEMRNQEREEGRAEGRAEERVLLIKKMLSKQMSPEEIIDICDCNMQEVQEIQSMMKTT